MLDGRKRFWYKVQEPCDPDIIVGGWMNLPVAGCQDTLEEARTVPLDEVAALNDRVVVGKEVYQDWVDLATQIKQAIKDGYVPEISGDDRDYLNSYSVYEIVTYEIEPGRKLRIEISDWGDSRRR